MSENEPISEHPLSAARLEKLKEIPSPYPVRYERTHLAGELQGIYGSLEAGASTGDVVRVAGRVMLLRRFGKLIFATVDDWSGRIQLLVSASDLESFAEFEALDLGDWIGAEGEIITTKKGELSVRVSDYTLLAKCLRPLPDKWHGLSDVELRSRRRYLDLIMNPETRRVALVRSRVMAELRRQFSERGYVEVETPVLQSLPGGALARPFVTHHNALDMEMYLRIATELHLKRLVVGGLEKVFEIGPIFRNEGIDATHNPEFTTLESYEALADYNDIMKLVEEVIPTVSEIAVGSTEITVGGRSLDLSGPFRRVRLVDAIAESVGSRVWPPIDKAALSRIAEEHDVAVDPGWAYGKILEEIFEKLVQPTIWEPTFVLDHPVDVSPLARRHRQDRELTERFELFIAGGEYANAFSELNDPIDQRVRFQQQARARSEGDGEAHPVDDEFLTALEYGMPPTGGLGIGVDRLVMLLTDRSHIREVILFPTLRPEGAD